eukprot:Sspe_Gene.96761::Locus_69902_Transcript_1_1_Confidence_1.000_Length_1496::g.96761::m.96761/K21971/NSUN6; methyltransferase NSUN6
MEFREWSTSTRVFREDKVHDAFKGWFGDGEFEKLSYALRLPPSATTLRLLRSEDLDNLPRILDELRRLMGPTRDVAQHPDIPTCILIRPKADMTRLAKTAVGGEAILKRHTNSVVTDLRCSEAVLRGADIFAPGILGSTCRYEAGVEVSVLAAVDPKQTPLKGELLWRDDTAKRSDLVHIANGITKMARAEVVAQGASGVAVKITERLVDHPPMDNVLVDTLLLQNLPSMLPPLLLDPQPGEQIIDMCAAPGGKTVHLGDIMQGRGKIVALDRSAKRVEELTVLVKRAKLDCVEVRKFDATKALKEWGERSFDRVLLDPPCTGLGLRPKLCHDVTEKQLAEFSSYQRKLFSVAAKLLKPGGVLVYSTCTISPLENECNVAWALGAHPELSLAPPQTDSERSLFKIGSPGLSGHGIADEALDAVIRFTPEWDSPTIGFFVARFVKKK